MMNILILGSGGREHALARQIARSDNAEKVFIAPGNGGTSERSMLRFSPTSEVPPLPEVIMRKKCL